MKIDANDPKWTAYALGEITDEKERAEIESILEESEEMRRLVEDIRQTAGILKAELQAEKPLGLTQEQRERIAEKAGAGKSWLRWKPAYALATAAVAVLAISFVVIRHLNTVEPGRRNNQIAALMPRESPATSQRQTEILDEPRTYTNAAPAAEGKAKMESSYPAQSRQDTYTLKSKESAAVNPPAPATLAESGVSAGNMPADKKVAELPAVSSDVQDAIKVMGGVVGEASSGRGVGSGVGHGVGTGMAGGAAGGVSATPALSVMPNSFAPVAQKDGITADDARFGRRIPMPPPPPPHKGMFPPWQKPSGDFNTEAYANILDNPFLDAAQNPLSTFSIDVDTASYSNVRRFLDGGALPPKDAVRIEELINYFDYDYKGPKNERPFAANFEITEAPWKPDHRLLRIGLKAREIPQGKRPDSNLVFLLDVSGSMADENKLPLVKESMKLLVDQLTEADRVSIVVYASDTSVFLPSTSGDQKEKLRHAIERLHAGGSTNGASGIQLAYKTAKENFIPGGINRVILATDGDFNVGMTNQGDLTRLIEDKAKSGIFLSALGFGMGNYKDSTLELLANKGRGNYAYIDTLNEAKKVLVEQINSTLVAVAKDVKIQVEFNPQRVSSYRLIGYEDRIMAKEDFNDDAKQAGVIGAGHAVTALYEIVPVGVSESKPGVDPLKYQKAAQPSTAAHSDELLTIKIRSKEPEKDTSVLSEFAVKESKEKFSEASQDFKFAASVAAFGMALRDSPYKGSASLESALEWAKEGKGDDKHGYRQEFIRLIHRAISISN
ncbi:MAG TPA: VWA domain-containing protein [Acidobacteriota bacterium]|nr:VWA domain-containing protein [Acidobacteriota bacterium]